MSNERPHHEVLLDHVNMIAVGAGKHPLEVLKDMEAQHGDLHEHVKKVVEQTGVSKDQVMRVLHSHASDDTHEDGKKRSDRWPTYRKHWLHGDPKLGVEPHPTCAACGSNVGVQVHHVRPFALEPSLECDDTYKNYVSVCESITDEHGRPGNEDHLHIAHGGSFHTYNPNVLADVAELLAHPERRAEIVERAKKNAKPLP